MGTVFRIAGQCPGLKRIVVIGPESSANILAMYFGDVLWRCTKALGNLRLEIRVVVLCPLKGAYVYYGQLSTVNLRITTDMVVT